MGADSPAENTPNASKNFSPKYLPKLKSSRFLKESSLWVSVYRGVLHNFDDFNLEHRGIISQTSEMEINLVKM
jgi:hypothetical protein